MNLRNQIKGLTMKTLKEMMLTFCLLVLTVTNLLSQDNSITADSGYVNVDGGKLFYEIAGEGENIGAVTVEFECAPIVLRLVAVGIPPEADDLFRGGVLLAHAVRVTDHDSVIHERPSLHLPLGFPFEKGDEGIVCVTVVLNELDIRLAFEKVKITLLRLRGKL